MRHLLVMMLIICAVALCAPCGLAQSAADKQSISDSLFEKTHLYYKSRVLENLINFDMPPAWWQRMKDSKGIGSLVYVTRDIGNFGKKMGWGDPEDVELCFDGPKDAAKPKIDEILGRFNGNVQLTVQAKQEAVTEEQFALATKYMEAVTEVLGREDWKPASGVAFVTLVLSSTAKALTAKPEADGKHFVVVAPLANEPNAIVRTISDGFRKKPVPGAATGTR